MRAPARPRGRQPASSRLFSQALAAYHAGRLAEAEAAFARVLTVAPGRADAWHMRGVCCMSQNRLDEAERYIGKAIATQPAADYYANFGTVMMLARRADEAIAAYRQCLRLEPDSARICSNLANLLRSRRELDEAERLYRHAIAVEPGYAHAWANLGALLIDRRAFGDAEAALRRSLALDPRHANAAATLGLVLERTGRPIEAGPWFKAAGRWAPLAANLRLQVAWDDLAAVDAACIGALTGGGGAGDSPWPLLNLPGMTPRLHMQAAREFATTELGAALRQPPLVTAVPRTDRLRLGYLSSDYFDHATLHLLAGVLEAHDVARFDVHLLSIGPQARADDRYKDRIAAMPATFHDLSELSDVVAADRIAAIAPHILIDLKGYTTNARPGIVARRPAPVIVNWLGYPGTIGHPRMADYIIGDAIVTPPAAVGDFTETLALMPHCYQPNDRARRLDTPPTRREAGLPDAGFVFCCFNQVLKLNPATFDLWCRLLADVPGSVLWLLELHAEGQANLRREAEARGVAGERLVFVARKPPPQHLARLQLADLALDTFPCTSHTTASDALWAGVPLVTRAGAGFASRVAASLLTTHGFAELVTKDDARTAELVLSLVREPARLTDLRLRLAEARQRSPLFDTLRFARDLERLYEAIWQHHAEPRDGRAPIVQLPAA